MINRLISDNEQDRAACRAWWNSASESDKLRVWLRIQDMADEAEAMENALDQIVLRFAQLGFAEMAERAEEPRP